jgi:hypothetical protein
VRDGLVRVIETVSPETRMPLTCFAAPTLNSAGPTTSSRKRIPRISEPSFGDNARSIEKRTASAVTDRCPEARIGHRA